MSNPCDGLKDNNLRSVCSLLYGEKTETLLEVFDATTHRENFDQFCNLSDDEFLVNLIKEIERDCSGLRQTNNPLLTGSSTLYCNKLLGELKSRGIIIPELGVRLNDNPQFKKWLGGWLKKVNKDLFDKGITEQTDQSLYFNELAKSYVLDIMKSKSFGGLGIVLDKLHPLSSPDEVIKDGRASCVDFFVMLRAGADMLGLKVIPTEITKDKFGARDGIRAGFLRQDGSVGLIADLSRRDVFSPETSASYGESFRIISESHFYSIYYNRSWVMTSNEQDRVYAEKFEKYEYLRLYNEAIDSLSKFDFESALKFSVLSVMSNPDSSYGYLGITKSISALRSTKAGQDLDSVFENLKDSASAHPYFEKNFPENISNLSALYKYAEVKYLHNVRRQHLPTEAEMLGFSTSE